MLTARAPAEVQRGLPPAFLARIERCIRLLSHLPAGRAFRSWVAMWKTADGKIEQAHWETHHEGGGVYHEVHIGQPAGGAPDPCQKAHEGHLL